MSRRYPEFDIDVFKRRSRVSYTEGCRGGVPGTSPGVVHTYIHIYIPVQHNTSSASTALNTNTNWYFVVESEGRGARIPLEP